MQEEKRSNWMTVVYMKDGKLKFSNVEYEIYSNDAIHAHLDAEGVQPKDAFFLFGKVTCFPCTDLWKDDGSDGWDPDDFMKLTEPPAGGGLFSSTKRVQDPNTRVTDASSIGEF